MKRYEVIVIGGGHAGCEAALAAARMGAETLLVTLDAKKIAIMPCNPSIGGVGKGQLVKEVDALGGEMGKNADYTGIHFKRLNTRKGSAVRSSRCQSDKYKYAARMQEQIRMQPRLEVIEAEASRLILKGERLAGLVVGDEQYSCESVVVTAGTFMRAVMHFGEEVKEGGRHGEKASNGLSPQLDELGFRLIRLKTGTPPRLAAETIDFSKLITQNPDKTPWKFSFSNTSNSLKQVQCHLGFTNEASHEVIRKNLSRSPLFSGQIKGIGPRYCPSIEDKIVKFPDKDRHQLFFEPEALDSNWIYPNGISTSLPKDVQEDFMRAVPGCESVEFLRYGYAVEYDCFDPRDLKLTLESKRIKGLYFAGQVNGTSGYEEAAAQGLLAGINAAGNALEKESLVLSREESYIGVMVDDLTKLGVNEPYRMFTSRAEYRLYLREDNADLRLRKYGKALGLVSEEEFDSFEHKYAQIDRAKQALAKIRVAPTEKVLRLLEQKCAGTMIQHQTLSQLLKRPELGLEDVVSLPDSPLDLGLEPDVAEVIEIEVKYDGYIAIQKMEIERLKKLSHTRIPSGFNYQAVGGLSVELRQKLGALQPNSLKEASQISGVTPAALSALLSSLRHREPKRL